MNRQEKNTTKDDNDKVFNRILWTTVILVAVFFVVFLFLYFYQFHGKLGGVETFAQFGDYLGGTVGTITAIAVFIATVMIIFLQKKELQATRDELEKSRTAQELQAKLFQQQQFETTFFTLLDKMNACKTDEDLTPLNRLGLKDETNEEYVLEDLTQFYLILRLIYQNIEKYGEEYRKEYRKYNKKQEITAKYNDIVKSYLDKRTLYKIFADDRLIDNSVQVESKNIYHDIKYFIETYSLFEYLSISDSLETFDIDKYQLSYYKISAFKGNDYLTLLRIEVEKDIKEIEKYAQHNDIMYRVYTLNNPKVPEDILINVLNSISFTNDYNKNKDILNKYQSALFDRIVYKLNKDIFYQSWYKIIEFCELAYCNKNVEPLRLIVNSLRVKFEKNHSIMLDFIDFLLDLIHKKNIIIVPVKILNYIVNRHTELSNIMDWGHIKEIIQEMDKVIPTYGTYPLNEEDKEYQAYLQEQNKLHQEMKPKLLKMIDENKEKLNINHLRI